MAENPYNAYLKTLCKTIQQRQSIANSMVSRCYQKTATILSKTEFQISEKNQTTNLKLYVLHYGIKSDYKIVYQISHFLLWGFCVAQLRLLTLGQLPCWKTCWTVYGTTWGINVFPAAQQELQLEESYTVNSLFFCFF